MTNYRDKFPDFDPATMPAWPEGAEDISEGYPEMVAPMITFRGWNIQIDYADPNMREHGDKLPRFSIWLSDEEVLSTDSWDEVLAFCADHGDAPDPDLIDLFNLEIKDLRESLAKVQAALKARGYFELQGDDRARFKTLVNDAAEAIDRYLAEENEAK